MNKPRAWICWLLLLWLMGEAQAQSARIIFFRNTGAVKSALTAQVMHQDSLWCQLRNQQAWTRLLHPGSYELRADLKIEGQQAKPLVLDLKADQLYLVELKLVQYKQGVLPSSGVGIRLVSLDSRRYARILRQKWLKRAIADALLEELNREFLRN